MTRPLGGGRPRWPADANDRQSPLSFRRLSRPRRARLPQLRPADLPPRNWAGFDAAVGAAVPFPLSASFLYWRDPAAALIWEVFDGKRGPKDALAAAADLIDMELAKERRS